MTASNRRPALAARDAAVFLDIDGTLLGFKDRPEDVVADRPLLDLLERLRAATGGALALNSGRRLSDIDRIVAPLRLAGAGTHGAELRFPDGSLHVAGAEKLDDAREPLRRFVEEHPGTMLEDKGVAICVHYRLAPEIGDRLAAYLDTLLPPLGLEVQDGMFVADVKAPGNDKGKAIVTLMAHPPFTGRTPVFIGDDLTDEKGFAAVNAAGGVSVKVGEGETFADLRLAGPNEVRGYLEALLSA